jgi:hypothetical protein
VEWLSALNLSTLFRRAVTALTEPGGDKQAQRDTTAETDTSGLDAGGDECDFRLQEFRHAGGGVHGDAHPHAVVVEETHEGRRL